MKEGLYTGGSWNGYIWLQSTLGSCHVTHDNMFKFKAIYFFVMPYQIQRYLCNIFFEWLPFTIYCDVPGSPCLSKMRVKCTVPFFFCERTKGSLTPCLAAAWSPGWFVGDPTPLARDNIVYVLFTQNLHISEN